MSEWREVRFQEVIKLNPRVKLEKNKVYPFIGIQDIDESTYYVQENEIKEFTGQSGSKFESGDTLFSRITPCLENRKIAQANLNVNLKGFGSTELLVFRAIKGLMCPSYVNYLAQTDFIVLPAINSMSGASGRQRANSNFIKKIKIMVPNIETQTRIVSTLSTYDKLIENNNRRIKILEQTAEELYKEWFVRMRFPSYEKSKFDKGIPEGWEVKKVKELVKRYRYGSLYKENDVMQEGNVIVIDQSEKDFLGFHNNEPDHFAGIDNPIILFGDHSCKMLIMTSPFSLSENVIPFNAENNLNTLFLFYAVRGLVHTTEYKRHWSDLTNKRILVPDYSLQQKFEAKVKSVIILINEYKKSNLNLIKQRDLLLPRLMNGTITVK